MSGKIEVKIRLGMSWIYCFNCKKGFKGFGSKEIVCPICKKENLGNVYDSYPEWYIEITDEKDSNKKVKLSPSWNQIKEFIRDVKVHELRVDKTRERKNDADKWEREIKSASDEAQTMIQDFDIPEIYYKPKLIK